MLTNTAQAIPLPSAIANTGRMVSSRRFIDDGLVVVVTAHPTTLSWQTHLWSRVLRQVSVQA